MTSNHISFGSEEGTIGGQNIRSVMIEQNWVLLSRHENNDYWTLPGDSPLFDETTKGLDRVKFGDDLMLMESTDSFSFCYLFKGHTYLAKQNLPNL